MAEGSAERPGRAESGEIATSTLAEIYAQQGLLGRALSIYRRMLTRTPEDGEIAARIERLERRIAETGPEVSEDPVAESAPDLPIARERLPWDPPTEPEDGATTAATEQPVPAEATSPPLPRLGPIDAQVFEAWLEGR
jgi:hypothetical protein